MRVHLPRCRKANSHWRNWRLILLLLGGLRRTHIGGQCGDSLIGRIAQRGQARRWILPHGRRRRLAHHFQDFGQINRVGMALGITHHQLARQKVAIQHDDFAIGLRLANRAGMRNALGRLAILFVLVSQAAQQAAALPRQLRRDSIKSWSLACRIETGLKSLIQALQHSCSPQTPNPLIVLDSSRTPICHNSIRAFSAEARSRTSWRKSTRWSAVKLKITRRCRSSNRTEQIFISSFSRREDSLATSMAAISRCLKPRHCSASASVAMRKRAGIWRG